MRVEAVAPTMALEILLGMFFCAGARRQWKRQRNEAMRAP